jgi:hypothetical protein
MTVRTLISRIGSLGLLAALLPAPLAGQDPPPTGPQRPDTAALVFDREVFVYPQYQRRDPFRALTRARDSGPRFEEMALLGVLYSPSPELSIAVLGPRAQGSGGEQQTRGRIYRVRRGETLGNFSILEIQPSRVVVQVDEFGLREQRTMELRRPGQGGLE